MDNQIEPKPNIAVIDEPELVLDEDEQFQLAKFLDALLEADMTNKSNERHASDGRKWSQCNTSQAKQRLDSHSQRSYRRQYLPKLYCRLYQTGRLVSPVIPD